jgi:hypothetical protein
MGIMGTKYCDLTLELLLETPQGVVKKIKGTNDAGQIKQWPKQAKIAREERFIRLNLPMKNVGISGMYKPTVIWEMNNNHAVADGVAGCGDKK